MPGFRLLHCYALQELSYALASLVLDVYIRASVDIYFLHSLAFRAAVATLRVLCGRSQSGAVRSVGPLHATK